MLRHRTNLVLRWGFAGFLGVMSLLGSQLHELLGIHHAGLLGHGESCELALQHRSSLAAAHSEACHDEASCPICNYLAQGRILGERFEGISVTANVPHRSTEMPLCLISPHLQPFQARAPPVA